MLDTVSGWTLEVDRGPDWLFVRLAGVQDSDAQIEDLAEQLWSLLDQHLIYRLILELDELPILPSLLIGQIVMLHKRIHAHGGMLRLSGLSDYNQQVLVTCRLAGRFPQYPDRTAAIMGELPNKPR